MPDVALLLVLVVVAVACGGEKPVRSVGLATVEIEVTKGVSVGDSTIMDVFRPGEGAGLPVLVLLHGTGDDGRAGMEPLARAIAERGVVVFVPEWKVIEGRPDRHTFDVEIYRAQTEAVVCALRRARRTAPDYGGSPHRLGLMGHSGGALVGLRAALVDAPPWPGMSCDDGVDHRPDLFVGTSGDYSGRYQFTGAAGDRYDPFDPAQLIGGNIDLEVELVHGFRDSIVDAFVSAQLHEQLLVAGYDARFTALDSRHGALIRPSEPAGQFVVDRVLMLFDSDDGHRDDRTAERTAELAFDGATCRYAGPNLLDHGEPLSVWLRNNSDAPAYFVFYDVEGVQLDAVLMRTPEIFLVDVPFHVDMGSGRMVPAGSDRLMTWAFVDRPDQWVLACVDDLQSDGGAYFRVQESSLVYHAAGLAPANLE